MPKAMYAIWWDDKLGPLVGRTYPPDADLSSEEALTIFMSHGVKQKADVGYTKLKRGLFISFMEEPNCIAVLLDEDEDQGAVERNLLRLVPRINFSSREWDKEIKKAFEGLEDLLDKKTGESLLKNPAIKNMLEDMYQERVDAIKPQHILSGVAKYPIASQYLGESREEIIRTLEDLEQEGVLVAKTFGRKVQCQQCGSSEILIDLVCPSCSSDDIHKVYTLFCPHCHGQFQAVIPDDLAKIACQKCQKSVNVSELAVSDVELLCMACHSASDEPRIKADCAVCGNELKPIDLLGGTGLAYYPFKTKNED
ncbi:hypothetical protein EU537_12105 [Candidatus Thorarchaeota archaeon]|nr:MAG: hypothetical protein EU537_12105 [Candidatus Thorarchaeota archaeon]